ncbi:MAG: ABC transporter ATP-binding protein [Anaerolineales bacterium]
MDLIKVIQSNNSPINRMDLEQASFPLVEIRNLYKDYHTPAGVIQALRGVNLKLYPAEFVAIVGKSGAGKSTLINVLAGIDTITSGEIYFRGEAVHSLSEEQKTQWRSRNLGVVFQFFQLLPTLNLIDNVKIAMDLQHFLTPIQRRERALELLDLVGIKEHAFKIPAKISGGQQQRVAIARALANDPALIVADEPTGNLDSHTAAEIFDLFATLAEQGKTVLIVTHDRGIEKWASRKVEMIDGLVYEK